MKSKTKAIFILLALVILIFGAYIAYSTISKSRAYSSLDDSAYEDAPDFTFYDKDNNAIKLSDYKGKFVVLNFWASWCGYCDLEMEGFNNAYNKYLDNDKLEFIMLNSTDDNQETVQTANKYYEENDFDFPIYYDLDMDGFRKFGVNGLPATYFINQNGKVIAAQPGYLEEELLKQVLEKIELDMII